MATRDQWYKPNLLYNIHYRPPEKEVHEPPKMIVETIRFNPSVCTCGEHGCEPKYRMEKRVLWTNKEIANAKQVQKTAEEEKKCGGNCPASEENIGSDEGNKNLEDGFAYGNEKNVHSQEVVVNFIEGSFRSSTDGKINSDGVECQFDENVGVRSNSDGCLADGKVCKDGTEMVRKKVSVIGDNSSDDSGDERIYRNYVGDKGSGDGLVRDESEGCVPNVKGYIDRVTSRGNDDDSVTSDSGGGIANEKIYTDGVGSTGNYDNSARVDSEAGTDDRSVYKDVIEERGNDNCSVRDNGGDGIDGFGCICESSDVKGCDIHGDRKSCSACSDDLTIGVDNNDDRTGTSGGARWQMQEVEISSTFGIMSIYCNSELHSWTMVIDEDRIE